MGKPVNISLDQVIPGWTEGIQKINRGGKIRLFIPSALAYGDDGPARHPSGRHAGFDIELLGIKPPGSLRLRPVIGPSGTNPGGNALRRGL